MRVRRGRRSADTSSSRCKRRFPSENVGTVQNRVRKLLPLDIVVEIVGDAVEDDGRAEDHVDARSLGMILAKHIFEEKT